MTAKHQATTGWRLSPEIDQRGRGDRAGAEQKRAKSSPRRSESQCGKGKRENEGDRLTDCGNLGAFDDGARQGSGREKIRGVLGRERDPGERSSELRGDHHERRREGDPDRAGRAAVAPENHSEWRRVGGLQKKL